MIRTKLILWNCTVLSLVLTAVGAAIYLTMRRNLLASVDTGLARQAKLFASTWRRPPTDWEDMPPEPPMGHGFILRGPDIPGGFNFETALARGADPKELREMGVRAQTMMPRVFGLDGRDLMFPDARPRDVAGFNQARAGFQSLTVQTVDSLPVRFISVPMRENGVVVSVAQMGSPLSGVYDELGHLSVTLLVMLPLAVAAMFGTGILLTRRALKPVAEIAAAAERIEGTNLNERLPVHGKDEFATLAGTFNSMLARLHESFESMADANARLKRFTADASHELKSPLTAILTRTGMAMRRDSGSPETKDDFQGIDRAAKAMSGLVSDLLLLASADENALPLEPVCTPAPELFGLAIELCDASPGRILVQADDAVCVFGDLRALVRAVANVLSNSLTHTPEQRKIVASAHKTADHVILTISDEGVGIPGQDLDKVFDRFHRVDRSRTRRSGGTGLGLSIAKSIVEAHCGRISIASKPGEGTKVVFTLPPPPPQVFRERVVKEGATTSRPVIGLVSTSDIYYGPHGGKDDDHRFNH